MNSAYTQIRKSKDKMLWLQADIDFEKGNYPSALEKYQELLELDTNNQSIIYNLGQCMYFLKFDIIQTKQLLEKVDHEKYADVDYYLASIYLKLREYSKANEALLSYDEVSETFRLYDKNETDILKQNILIAQKYEAIGNQNVQISNLGATINTKYPDYAPLINYQKNKLIFTSRRTTEVYEFKGGYYSSYDKIYECNKTDSGWSYPVLMESLIDFNVHNAATSISFGGDKIMFYRSTDDNLSGNIYESKLIENIWTKPEPIGFKVNSQFYTEPSACYSNEENIIFFASDRPGGYGGKDIYYVKKLPNGLWGEPFNLGPEINTPFNEDGPFLHPVTNDLYFSSQGHENMGGFDVFVSSYNDKGEFERPKNLGYPINSSSNDIFYTINYDFSQGYVSSDRQGGFGATDIYQLDFIENKLPIMVYSVFVQNSKGDILNNVEITLTDKATKNKVGLYKSNELSGKILIITEPNSEVEMEIKNNDGVIYKNSWVFNEKQNIVIPITEGL